MIYCNYDFDKLIGDKYFDHLSALPPIQRSVEKLRLELEDIPLHILENDYIFGWFGFDSKLSIEGLRQIVPYHFSEEELKILNFPKVLNCNTNVDRAHTLADYERIINHGLISYEDALLKELSDNPCDEYLLAMKKTVDTVRAFSKRLASFADAKANDACGEERERLLAIRDAVARVPYQSARTFVEALQSIWIIHFLIPLAENAWYSISLGSFDQYMLPYYEKAIAEGKTKGEIKSILHNFYKLLNSYADGACLLNVGGEEYTEFSELLIECQKEFGLPAPILAPRISEKTPQHIFDLLIDEKLFSRGQPTFYSEEGCRAALLEKGVSLEDVNRFANNSCMGIGIPGKEANSMWGCVFNVPAALEATLNGGKVFSRDDLSVITPDGKIEDIDTLFEQFRLTCAALLDKCLAAYALRAKVTERYMPDVFLSLITDDCIKNHSDRMSGANYHNITVECFGMVNVSDGICAIDTLVFKEKKYTIEQITEAAKCNFDGFEQVRKDILNCKKYGTNSEADEYAVKVAEILAELIRTYDHGNCFYQPSLHTLDGNVRYGGNWGASYDGRLAGTPLAKNAGPCNEVRSVEPTSALMSAAKLPQYKFYGGQPIDIKFDPKVVRTHKEKIAALIKTYLKIGGLQFQVNAVSSETLRDAVANPDMYKDLIVRIGGYSNYFNRFSMQTKLEFIERFEKEEN